jgi:ribose transport system ATP-binding protein
LTPRPILQATKLTKTYGGVIALSDASIELKQGVIVALIGENGAGKTTLVKILSGAILPDDGTIRFFDKSVKYDTTTNAQDLGIRVVHQIPSLVPELSIVDNMFLGNEVLRDGRLRWAKRVDFVKQKKKLKPYLSQFAPHLDPDIRVKSLKANELRLLGIIKALLHSARVLIMDEPTAALPASERTLLMNTVQELRDRGLAILYVSHHLEEIELLADEVVALRDGRVVGHEMPTPDVDRMVELMVGQRATRLINQNEPIRSALTGGHDNRGLAIMVCPPSGPTRRATSVEDKVHLKVAPGEVVVLTGLASSGIQETAEAAFGAQPDWDVTLIVDGQTYSSVSPHRTISTGVGYLSDDRSEKATIPDLSIRANASIAAIKKITMAFGWLNERKEKREIKQINDSLRVRRANDEQKITELSGGNQQKVMLGRWLFADSRFMILNEPTQGIDVMAKIEIINLLKKYVANGGGLLIVATESEEFLPIASRVVVMRQGKICSEFTGANITNKQVTEAVFVNAPKG